MADTARPAGLTLGSIDLAELSSRAELHTRIDRKYIVTDDVAERMLIEIRPGLSMLEIDGRRSFGYESVYFDTDRFALHRAAATGRRRRFKVRTRHYVHSSLVVLEVKAKDGRGRTVKHRLDYDIADQRRLTGDAQDFVDAHSASAGMAELLHPVLTTRYDRSTVLDDPGGSRCTLDRGLVCTHVDGATVSLDRVIIETKSDGQAGAIDRWLWQRGLRPVRLSKYCTALALMMPDLPSNKWHRTIHRYFD